MNEAAQNKLWFMSPWPRRGDSPADQTGAGQQLEDGAFIRSPQAALAEAQFDPSLEYGRGDGWSDRSWGRFDRAQTSEAMIQQTAADQLNAAAGALESSRPSTQDAGVVRDFERHFGRGRATPDNMRRMAQLFEGNVGALRSGADQGYVADAYAARDWRALMGSDGKPLRSTVLGAARHGDKRMLVNSDHPQFADDYFLQWTVGHEPFHGEGGLFDEKVGAVRAYRYADDEGRALRALRRTDPARASRNPDSLLEFAHRNDRHRPR